MTTTSVTLTTTGYTSLGTGPLSVVPPQKMTLLVASGTSPAADTSAAAVQCEPHNPLNFGFTDTLYAKVVVATTLSNLVVKVFS